MAENLYTMEVIGVVECAVGSVEEVPSEGLPSTVIVKQRYSEALQGLEVGDDLYVMTVFDRSDGRTMVGSAGGEHANGAFSIRSSARPNRIGMTLARLVEIDGCRLSFDWLDFADGTPVIDIKRYNWRWEVVPGTRHLDRRYFERQIEEGALLEVLERAAAKFHGERCAATREASRLAVLLSRDIFLGDPGTTLAVTGDGHLAEALQVLFGAMFGNGRLGAHHGMSSGVPTVTIGGNVDVVAQLVDSNWKITRGAS